MIQAFLIAALLLVAAPVYAAISFVQSTSCSGNDATCTWASAPSSSNFVLVLTNLNTESNTMDITSWTNAETPLGASPYDDPIGTHRVYAFCTVGDDADTTMVMTTSGSGGAGTAAIEVSGLASCVSATIFDVFAEANIASTTTHSQNADVLTTDLATAEDGEAILAIIESTSAADFTTTGSGTSIPAGDAEIGTTRQGQYYIAGAAGTKDVTWTSASAEITYIVAVAIKAAAAAPSGPATLSFSMLGVSQ